MTNLTNTPFNLGKKIKADKTARSECAKTKKHMRKFQM